ncbi:DUF982 domain-containing protein [Bosea sp. UC22_33]|uniref:DUF982 domain-containing protein n=1 Tax=Bosea sp. UC22_33 TaxID=3350165 RepID=UPI00366DC42B
MEHERLRARRSENAHRPQKVSDSLRFELQSERFCSLRRIGIMPLHWFSSPVYVATPKAGECFAVFNVERAAEFLLSWKGHGGDHAWQSAVLSCMAAMKGQGSTAAARSAFETAARSSGMLL